MIKDAYNNIKTWLDVVGYDKVKYLSSRSKLKEVGDIFEYYNNLPEEKEYIFGEKIVSLKDISDYVISLIDEKIKDVKQGNVISRLMSNDEYYDWDGYYNSKGLSILRKFWENLTEKRLKEIYTGENELDLNGGRLYIISRSRTSEMIFNYLYYTKKLSSEDFKNSIYNSSELNDGISEIYVPENIQNIVSDAINFPTSDYIDNIYKLEIEKENLESVDTIKKQIASQSIKSI